MLLRPSADSYPIESLTRTQLGNHYPSRKLHSSVRGCGTYGLGTNQRIRALQLGPAANVK